MTLFSIALVCSSIAGLAVFAVSIAVLYDMHLADRRWLSACGWLCTAVVGCWLLWSPQSFITPQTWPIAFLVVTLAVVLWQHLRAIRAEAVRPSRHRLTPSLVGLALLGGCLSVAPVMAALKGFA